MTSTVKGIDICLDSRILGEILQLPSEGYSYMELPIKEEGIRIILGEDFSGSLNKLEAKLLSIEMRVLHQIVTKLFFPRSGRHDLLSGRDVCVMFHIITQTPLNLPALMIEAMRETLNRSKAHLPYGMALTRVFRRFGVSCEGETPTKLSHVDTFNQHSLLRMGITKTIGGWIKGSEERAEERAETRAEDRTEGRVEEEGPSSPVHDFRAASPDTQFIPDTEAGPSEFTRMPTPVYQPESRAPHSEFRLADDQIEHISQHVASLLSSQWSSTSFAPGATSSDQTITPHISTVFQMISDQSVRIQQLEDTVWRLTGRVLDLQGQVLALAHPQPQESTIEVTDLTAEAGRLRGALEGGYELLRKEIRGSSEHATTQFTALLQSVSRALNVLDSIRLTLSVQSLASQRSQPPSSSRSSARGRGRRGRGRTSDPSSPHPISDDSDH